MVTPAAEAALAMHVALLYPSEDTLRVRLRDELKKASVEGHFGNEGWCMKKDGTRFWANVITMALKDERGDLQGFARVVRDFTDRRERDPQKLRGHALESPLGRSRPTEPAIAGIVSASGVFRPHSRSERRVP